MTFKESSLSRDFVSASEKSGRILEPIGTLRVLIPSRNRPSGVGAGDGRSARARSEPAASPFSLPTSFGRRKCTSPWEYSMVFSAIQSITPRGAMTRCPITDRDGVERCVCDPGDILVLLADARRRAVVSARSGRRRLDGFRPIGRRVVEETPDVSAETWRIELHHVHLPALEDRGVIVVESHAGLS